ncbi:unnamed protein product, partial [Amoebophrya sp. A25]|eukprot:GSA25T00003456001.1
MFAAAGGGRDISSSSTSRSTTRGVGEQTEYFYRTSDVDDETMQRQTIASATSTRNTATSLSDRDRQTRQTRLEEAFEEQHAEGEEED